jgi:uncharacterized protein DUF7010
VDSLSALRVDLARRSKWNIGYLVAGLVYWSFAAVVGTILPMESAKVLWMIGGFTVFPMAIGFSYVLRSDPFSGYIALARRVIPPRDSCEVAAGATGRRVWAVGAIFGSG